VRENFRAASLSRISELLGLKVRSIHGLRRASLRDNLQPPPDLVADELETIVLDLADAPPLVPDLAALIRLVGEYATADEWTIEDVRARLDEEKRAISERFPAHGHFAHVTVEGAKFIRRQKDSGRNRPGWDRARNINMAAECIKRRRDRAYDEYSDTSLMTAVGQLEKFKLDRSQAIEACKDGLSDPMNQIRIRESEKHRRPDKRRSIFDASKGRPAR
jgi:hypothetical protein